MPRTELVAAVDLDLELQDQLRSELAALADLRRQIAELKAVEDAIASTVEDIRAVSGQKTLAFEGAKITRVEPKDRGKFDKAAFVRAFDVTLDDIESCTKYSPVKPSTRITLPGEKEPEY